MHKFLFFPEGWSMDTMTLLQDSDDKILVLNRCFWNISIHDLLYAIAVSPSYTGKLYFTYHNLHNGDGSN